MPWNHAQQVALAIVPKFSAVFSLFGSIWIVVEVLTGTNPQDNKPKRQHPYHRLLLAMSIYDILESIWNFASSWAIPRGTEGVFRPLGTTATCSAQGFFLTLSVAVPIYNAFLSLYYVLVVNYRMTDEMLKRRVEPFMHLTAFVWAFGTALTSAFLGLLNNANLWCWIAPYPAGCVESTPFGESGTCTRGDYSGIFRWVFYFGPLWLCIAFAAVCTVIMCSYVANLDKRTLAFRRPERSTVFSHNSSSFNLDGTTAGATIANINDDSLPPPEDGEESGMNFVSRWLNRRKVFARDNPRTVEVQIQALHYLGVFFVTHIWSTTNRIMQQTRGKTIFGVILVHSIFDPLQGFLNFCVYQRTRYLRLRKRNNMSRCSAAMLALRFSFLPKMDIEQSPGGTSSTRSKNESEQSLTMSRFSNTFSDGRALQSIQEVSESELSVVASESSTSLPHAPSSDLRPQGIHEEKDGASEEVTESRMLPSLESSIYDDSDKDSVDDLLEAASRRLVGRAQAHS